MKIKSKYISLIIIFFIILISILYTVRYIQLNDKYPDPEIIEVKKNEELKIGSYIFKVTDTIWSDGSKVDSIIPGYISIYDEAGNPYPTEKQRLGLIHLEIRKTEEDDTYIDLTHFAFESGAWHNQWDSILFDELNGMESMDLKLEKGDKTVITFPLLFLDYEFKEEDWNNFSQRKLYMILANYPVKYQINLSE